MEYSTKAFEREHKEETLSCAILRWMDQGVNLSWNTLWFLPNHNSVSKALIAFAPDIGTKEEKKLLVYDWRQRRQRQRRQ